MSSLSTTKILRSTDGTEIFAEATGNPSNTHIVLLAGLTLSGCVFDDLCSAEALLNTLYIVRYDVRGHGRSGKPATTEAYESKRFAEDFKTVMDAFGLKKPILAGWSMGATVATDVCTHLPPATLSGVLYLSGIPCTGEILSQLAAPSLVAALPGLLSNDSVVSFQTSAAAFTDKLFVRPQDVPYAVKCMYMGNNLTPEIMGLSLTRPMGVAELWKAGAEGLPLLVVQGTEDGHRKGGEKTVEDVMKPQFKDYDVAWLEGRGHALHYECPGDVINLMLAFAQRVGGKDYRASQV